MSTRLSLIHCPADLEGIKEDWSRFCESDETDCGVFCHPELVSRLVDFNGGSCLALAEVTDDIGKVAVLPFVAGPSKVGLRLGLWRIHSADLRVIRLTDYRFACRKDEYRLRILEDVVGGLCARIGGDIFTAPNCRIPVSGEDEAFPAGLRRLRRRNMQRSYLINVRGSFEEFEQGLSRITRKGFRRRVREIETACDGSLELRAFSRRAEMREMREAWNYVWKKSWKGKLGMYPPPAAGFLEAMADKDWIRCHLLIAGGSPVACAAGLRFGGVFLREWSAYDSAWKSFAPGSVLTWLSLKDIFENDKPDVVDMGFGYNEYKEILGNRSEMRCEIWSPLSPKGRVFGAARSVLDATYRAGKATLGRIGLSAAVKRNMKS